MTSNASTAQKRRKKQQMLKNRVEAHRLEVKKQPKKLSDQLMEFAEPLFQMMGDETEEQVNMAMAFATACWNIGGHPEELSEEIQACLLYTSPSPRDGLLSRMPSSA